MDIENDNNLVDLSSTPGLPDLRSEVQFLHTTIIGDKVIDNLLEDRLGARARSDWKITEHHGRYEKESVSLQNASVCSWRYLLL